jgi:plastocyanin
MMRNMTKAAMAIGLAGLVLTGCGKAATTTPGGGGSSSPTGGGIYGGGGGTTTPPSPTGGGTAAATVSQINYQFSPSTLTVKSGSTLAVKDATTGTPHTFTITGKGVDVMNNAGQTQTVTISLPPGTYTFFCRYHVSMGMRGTLTVT